MTARIIGPQECDQRRFAGLSPAPARNLAPLWLAVAFVAGLVCGWLA
jgi:hypothetical protein